MTGIEFIKIVKELSPWTFRLMISGQMAYEKMMTYIENEDIHAFSTKPVSMEDLIKAIEIGVRYFQKRQNEKLKDLP